MAKHINVTLTDDLNPELPADETVEFSIDGTNYEIDLNTSNADELRKVLTPWIEASRKVAGRYKGRRPATVHKREETAAIKAWAKEQGMTVPVRGRIPAKILDAYAHRGQPTNPVDAVLEHGDTKAARTRKAKTVEVAS